MLDTARNASVRAYTELTNRGTPDVRAFDVALTVLLNHIPDLDYSDATFLVADWICDALDQ